MANKAVCSQSMDGIMLLPFDAGTFFIPHNLVWIDEANSCAEPELMGDLLRIQTIVPTKCTNLAHPFKILDYFKIPYSKETIGEYVWEAIGDIQMKVFTEMLALTGNEYRLDWSRHTHEFCLWYRSLDQTRNATADINFNRTHTIQNISMTEIRHSSVHGFGLFSTGTFHEGDLLCVLDGQWMDFEQYDNLRIRLNGALGRINDFLFMEWTAFKGRFLVRPFRTSYSFINHSVMPNTKIVQNSNGSLSLVASKPIFKDDEIFVDYRQEELPRGYLKNPSSQYLQSTLCTQTRQLGGKADHTLILPG
jgi:hypothetical protein